MWDFSKQKEGLDFSDAEDRAIFRQRVREVLPCKLSVMRDWCAERGIDAPRTRSEALRLIADWVMVHG